MCVKLQKTTSYSLALNIVGQMGLGLKAVLGLSSLAPLRGQWEEYWVSVQDVSQSNQADF